MTLDLPRSDWLASFVAFAVEVNFTRAARAVPLSQPAFFAQIKKLEECVGVPLHVREGRTLALTEAGVATAAFARDVLSRTRDWQAALAGG
jgi:DNA-binding transcriptional LysR family regulator